MTLPQQIVNGLSLGSIYALIAVGFSLVYGILGVMNFAHGAVAMAGALTAFVFVTDVGVSLWVAVAAALAVGIGASVLVERVASRPFRGQPHLVSIMTTFAMALVITGIAELKTGTAVLPFDTPATGESVALFGLRISLTTTVTLGLALATMVVFGAFLSRTKSGFAIRALSQDVDAAALMGIPINKSVVTMFAASGALAVVGGLLYTAAYGIFFSGMAFMLLMKGFIASVIGGIGSLKGAVLGGLLLGMVESVVGGYAGGTYANGAAFLLLIVVLLIKPNGLLGRRVEVRV